MTLHDLPPLNDVQGTQYIYMPSGWHNCSGGDITHVDQIEILQWCPHHRWEAYYPDLPCSLKQNIDFWLLIITVPVSTGSPWRQVVNFAESYTVFLEVVKQLFRSIYTYSSACMSRICLHLCVVRILSVLLKLLGGDRNLPHSSSVADMRLLRLLRLSWLRRSTPVFFPKWFQPGE